MRVQVFAIGGWNGSFTIKAHASVDKFNPATNTWSTVASMLQGRMNFFVGLLPDGKILVAGGTSDTIGGQPRLFC